mgnify:CR=1 FL=1
MHIVEEGEPRNFPGVCVFTKTSDDDLLDTGFWLNAKELDTVDPYGYVAVGFLKTMAREIGMVDGSELEAAKAEIAELRQEMPKAEAWDAYQAAREAVPACASLRPMPPRPSPMGSRPSPRRRPPRP